MEREYRKVNLDDVRPYRNNPRKNDRAVDTVVKSIEQCGYVAPIIVDENMEILAGNTRYKALRILGEAEHEVLIVSGMTDEEKRKYRLLDNKTGELASWDPELLPAELEGLDFGDMDLDWGIGDTEAFIDLDEESGQEKEKKLHHCPKCGFEFED